MLIVADARVHEICGDHVCAKGREEMTGCLSGETRRRHAAEVTSVNGSGDERRRERVVAEMDAK